MMDHFITLGDLLKLGSFLLDLTSVILYIYYNQKIVKSITIKRKRNNRPRIQLWRLFFDFLQWEQTVYWCALFLLLSYIIFAEMSSGFFHVLSKCGCRRETLKKSV